MNLKRPSQTKTAFGIIACLFLLVIFGLIRSESTYKKARHALDSMVAKENAEKDRQLIVNNLMRVARSTSFLREMPQDQAMLWNAMVQMATLSPESSATMEWSPGVVPLTVSMSEPETGISCHVVLGTVDTAGMNDPLLRAVSFKPCLVYYIGARPGQTFRFDNLNNVSTARYYGGYGTGYLKFQSDEDSAPMADTTRRLINTRFINGS